MSQAYSTGPAFTSVRVRGNGFYLGTPERDPDLTLRPEYEQVMNDLAGGKVPFDMMYVGQDAIVSFDLTVWNSPVLEQLKAFGDPGFGVAGRDNSFDRGTLMLTEGMAFELFIGYPRASLPAMATLPAGYHFHAAYLMGPHKMSPGVKTYKERCVFYCLGRYDFSARQFTIYDHEMGNATLPD